jgi:uncharacterized membrane protein YjfL (UPF0719 family)
MLHNIGLILSYGGIGLGLLVVGFFVLDILTPGRLGSLLMNRNENAALIAASNLACLGLIMWFAIFFTGAGYGRLDDFLVYGALGVVMQAVGFVVLDTITPGKLGDICHGNALHPAARLVAGMNLAVALIVCASLT